MGIVHHPALYPLVGGSPYDPSSKEVTTSADLHVLPTQSLAVMQIRVPLIKVSVVAACLYMLFFICV